MRAYTVAAWAFHQGADRLILVDDVEEAVNIASAIPGALLFKDGAPDERFALHNSPRQLLDLDVAGRTIVQRTNAGTRAAVASRGADRMLCAALVCASATAEAVRRIGVDRATFVVSGGLDADEDLACAELIARRVDDESIDCSVYVTRASRSRSAIGLTAAAERRFPGVTVDDVPMCLEVDRFDFAMEAVPEAEHLVLRRFAPT